MTSYTLQKKAAPGLDPAAAAAPEPDALAPDAAAKHEWAGDLYENDDVSDPAAAFASFSGVEGEQAWLDRHDDGTLVGWVRDADGSVYRYTDADAWAIDVQDAGMERTDAEQDAAAPEDAEGALVEEDPTGAAPDDLAAEGPAAEAPAAEDAPLEEPAVDAPPAGDELGDGDPLDDLADQEDAEPDPDDEEDEEDAPPFQAKSFRHASGVGRIHISPR
ncbi:hypothetical protein ACFCZ3_19670 [Cellulosimicrobium cellulans]|uniref:hypothetical protein n=1 Tax=Cellulosimicrobium cellulans TaxID=1710 RepID=UPI0035DB89F0